MLDHTTPLQAHKYTLKSINLKGGLSASGHIGFRYLLHYQKEF